MRLSKLQIKGFKSFADNTVVNFNEPVIGIVGPNGSGKSNIVDSIRWVLGESKSSELRLNKMVDVIFNGTKSRKKSKAAQVSLTFENSLNILPTDYQTVTISRIVYQSGESEYKLNNVTCRRKDITSLFVDTGIGSNSYAIISLGMVDDILADKQNSRRMMFEQASGISKYKVRKKETLNKLKNTTDDLERVEDLLFELEGNLKALEKQANRTQKFYKIKEDYKTLSLQAAKHNLIDIEEQQGNIGGKIQAEEDQYDAMSKQLQEVETRLENSKTQHLEKEENLSALQKELNNLLVTNKNLEHKKDLSQEKIQYNSKRIKELESDDLNLNAQLEKMTQELGELRSQIDIDQVSVTKAQTAKDEANQAHEVLKSEFDNTKQKVDQFTQLKIEKERTIFDAEKQRAVLLSQISSVSKEIDIINQEIADKQSIISESESKQNQKQASKDNLESELNSLVTSMVERQKTINELTEDIELDKQKIIKHNRKLDAISNERDLVKNMIDNLEGYPESIKYLSANWEKKVPILADLISVEDKYKGIVEHYLEPYLNFYVCDDVHDAAFAISLLTRTQKGKAKFFLLDQVREKQKQYNTNPKLDHILNHVRFDDRYGKLLISLLHNVFVYNGELSEAVSEYFNEDIVLLSSTGNFIRERSKFSGGSVGLFEGTKIGRKQHLEELGKNIISLQKEIQEAEGLINHKNKQLDQLKSEDKTNQIEDIKKQIQILDQEIVRYNTEQSTHVEAITSLTQKKQTGENHLSGSSSQLSSVKAMLEDNSQALSQMMQDNNLENTDISELSNQLSQSAAKLNELNIDLIQKQNDIENIRKDEAYKSTRIHEISSQLQKNKEVTSELSSEISTLSDELKNAEEELIGSHQLQKEKEGSLGTFEQNYFQARSSIMEDENQVKKLNTKIGRVNQTINQLREKATSFKFQLSGIIERLNIEFNIPDLSMIKDVEDSELELDELNNKVKRLKSRIGNFGEINPLALEAFDEMKQRYDAINGQRNDILEAKENLMETIKEIEETATEKFMEAFTQIKTNFKEVFRSLFTEDDDCDLILLNTESPMDADIEIIAKPKGKRPRSLSQLSGGEKTLTAIALLFSLYLLKPAPFCIFDEVDAPLDDVNIQKFNKIIKKFSGQSQFIVVTHNKLTMAEVDILYGVYMQEQGVSGLSAVDFRNYEYDPTGDIVRN